MAFTDDVELRQRILRVSRAEGVLPPLQLGPVLLPVIDVSGAAELSGPSRNPDVKVTAQVIVRPFEFDVGVPFFGPWIAGAVINRWTGVPEPPGVFRIEFHYQLNQVVTLGTVFETAIIDQDTGQVIWAQQFAAKPADTISNLSGSVTIDTVDRSIDIISRTLTIGVLNDIVTAPLYVTRLSSF